MSQQAARTGHFCWNELATGDTGAAKHFYTELFGWGHEDRPMPGAPGEYTIWKLEGTDIGGLYQLGPQFAGVPPHWSVYVAVDDVDAIVKAAKEAGGNVIWGPFDVPGIGRMGGIADPTGAVIAVIKILDSGEAAERPDMNGQAGSFCWAELHTNDVEAAGPFYRKVFGWESKSGDAGPMKYYEWINAGVPIGGMMAIDPNWGEVPPNWMTYVAVADCDATVAKASELGAQILVPATTIPEVGRFSMFSDPTGAALAVIWLDPEHLNKK